MLSKFLRKRTSADVALEHIEADWRNKNKFYESRQRGLTFLEIIFFITIGIILTSGGYFIFESANKKTKVQETTYFMVNIQSAVRDTFFRRAATGDEIDIPTYLFQAGIIESSNPNEIEHPFEGGISINTIDNGAFDIILEDLPVEVCTQIAGFNANGQGAIGVGISGLVFNGIFIESTIGGTNTQDAGNLCVEYGTGTTLTGSTVDVGWRFDANTTQLVASTSSDTGSGSSGSTSGSSGISGDETPDVTGSSGSSTGTSGSSTGSETTSETSGETTPSDGSISDPTELQSPTHDAGTTTAAAGTESRTGIGDEVEVSWISSSTIINVTGPGNPAVCVLDTLGDLCTSYDTGSVTIEPGQYIRIQLEAPTTVGNYYQYIVDVGGQTVGYTVQAS